MDIVSMTCGRCGKEMVLQTVYNFGDPERGIRAKFWECQPCGAKIQFEVSRSCKVGIEILKGEDILARGHGVARQLWNFVRHCVKLYSVQHYPRPRKLGKRKNKKGKLVDNWQRPVRKNLCQDYLPWVKKFGAEGLDTIFRDAWQAKELHDRCYSAVIREYFAGYKAFKTKVIEGERARPPGYCENPRALYFDSRNMKSLGDWKFQLTVLGGRRPHRHAIVKVHARPGLKIRDIRTLTIHADGMGVVTYSVTPKAILGDNVVAVDLGEVNLLTMVELFGGESVVIRGRKLIESNQKFDDLMDKCKPSGYMGEGHKIRWPKHSPRKKSYNDKQKNARALAIHNVTAFLREFTIKHKAGTVVFGAGLGNIPKDKSKDMNRRLSLWPVGRVGKQAEYKLEEVGGHVVYDDEAYTSQDCYVCGRRRKANRKGDVYTCDQCGDVSHADVNGAINQLANYTGKDCSWISGQPSQVLEFAGNWSLHPV